MRLVTTEILALMENFQSPKGWSRRMVKAVETPERIRA